MALPSNKIPRQELEDLLPMGSFWWLLESAPDGIVIVSSDGGILLVNAQAEGLFGYSEDELIGKPVETLIPGNMRAQHVGYRSRYSGKPQARPMGAGLDLSGLRKDGSEFPVEISLSPVHTKQGLLVMAIIRDVTEYKRERFISDTLQKAMLSSVPESIDGIKVASAYHSAYTGAQVGGDFFDVFAIDPELIGIVIGDVSGKGIEASVHTAMARYSLRAYAYQDPAPESVLEKLNDTVCRQGQLDDFITTFYGLLNVNERAFSYANAGHMSPLHLDYPGNEVTEVSAIGLPLGVLPEARYEPHIMPIKSGDKMLLYSDGVTEARGGSELYGVERLTELFRGKGSDQPADFISHLVTTLEEWSGDRLHDDVALLLVTME